jgi:ammonium transporter, Amt family
MQSGFAMLCAGSVRKKNVGNTMLKNLLDACGSALAFFSVGYAFAFGGDNPGSSNKTFIGTTSFFLIEVEDMAFWLFQYSFSAASATIVAGALAERSQMVAYLCYSVVLGGFVYPVVAHAVWSSQGFLSPAALEPLWGVGMIDFAGSAVVHMSGGTTALFAVSSKTMTTLEFHVPLPSPILTCLLRNLSTISDQHPWSTAGSFS